MELPIVLRRILYSRMMLVASIIIFIVVFFQLIQVVTRGSDTDKEVSGLQKQVDDLTAEQKRLEQMKSFLQTDFFAEREARTKFGMQKSGEHTVIITRTDQNVPTGSDSIDSKASESKKAAAPRDQISSTIKDETNNHLWFRYFFGTQ